MQYIRKDELIKRAYEEAEVMDPDCLYDNFGVLVEWLADKTTTINIAEENR